MVTLSPEVLQDWW